LLDEAGPGGGGPNRRMFCLRFRSSGKPHLYDSFPDAGVADSFPFDGTSHKLRTTPASLSASFSVRSWGKRKATHRSGLRKILVSTNTGPTGFGLPTVTSSADANSGEVSEGDLSLSSASCPPGVPGAISLAISAQILSPSSASSTRH